MSVPERAGEAPSSVAWVTGPRGTGSLWRGWAAKAKRAGDARTQSASWGEERTLRKKCEVVSFGSPNTPSEEGKGW